MAQYTRKAIRQTFLEMLREMPFDKITVSALVNRCEVSSNTFYYHYHDIFDLLFSWMSDELAPLLSADENSWKERLTALLERMQAHPKVVYHLSSSTLRERMERYIFLTTNGFFEHYIEFHTFEAPLSAEQKKNMADFCRYAFLGFVARFIWNRMEGNVRQSVDELERLMEQFVVGANVQLQKTSGSAREDRSC